MKKYESNRDEAMCSELKIQKFRFMQGSTDVPCDFIKGVSLQYLNVKYD